MILFVLINKIYYNVILYCHVILLFSGDLSNTDPQNFIYVELNAILQANAVVLAQFFKLLGNQAKFKYYDDIGQRFQIGINAVSDIIPNIFT